MYSCVFKLRTVQCITQSNKIRNALNKQLNACKPWRGSVASIHTSRDHRFWEEHRKGGYITEQKVSTLQHIRNGFKQIKSEIRLWTEEVREHFENDPLMIARPGETDLVWCFDGADSLTGWTTTCDRDHGEGWSSCWFEPSPSGRALFHGNLDTRAPKDGRVKRAGYCSVRSGRTRKSFKRDSTFDWSMYNTLVLRVRGDGRSYLLNLSTEGVFDITWNDIYHYVLYTRGGPYWQTAKIPFSKFILASKGRVQDKQNAMRLDRVTHFGFASGDKVNGPFQLEVEYVGLEFDPNHTEEFAYEMYRTERYIVGV